VVPNGSRAQIVDACISNAPFWKDVIILPLTINMRLLRNRDNMTMDERKKAEDFAEWLLQVGEGLSDGPPDELLTLPEECCIHPENGLDNLIASIYPSLNTLPPTNVVRSDYFKERIILAARNTDVDELNTKILERLPGTETTFLSADKASDKNANNNIPFPLEYLNNINIPGIPLHKTVLKVGCPVILLRNLDPSAGLCNGTRLLVTRFAGKVIEGKILMGQHAGQTFLIPRIALDTGSSSGLPFTLTRVQFPIRLAFSITINKAQGQSLKFVGLNLLTPVFAHGQLYVALSRATDFRNVKILLDNSLEGRRHQTSNVTYTEVLSRTRVR
jgi:PIF1-like helicase